MDAMIFSNADSDYHTILVKDKDGASNLVDMNVRLFTCDLFPRAYSPTAQVMLPRICKSDLQMKILFTLFLTRIHNAQWEQAMDVVVVSKRVANHIFFQLYGKPAMYWMQAVRTITRWVYMMAEICDCITYAPRDEECEYEVPVINVGYDVEDLLLDNVYPHTAMKGVYMDYEPAVSVQGIKEYRLLRTGSYCADTCITSSMKDHREWKRVEKMFGPIVVLRLGCQFGGVLISRDSKLDTKVWHRFAAILELVVGRYSGVFFLVTTKWCGAEKMLIQV